MSRLNLCLLQNEETKAGISTLIQDPRKHWSSEHFLATSRNRKDTGIVDFHRFISTNYEFILPHTEKGPHKRYWAETMSSRCRLPHSPCRCPPTHTHIHSPDNSDPGTSLSTEWKIKVCMKGSTKEYIFERKNEQAKSNCQKWQVTFEKNEIEHISNIKILNPINRFAY